MISQEPQSNCKVGVCRPCGKNNSAMEPGHWPRQLITEVLGLELRTVAPKPLTPPFASSPPRISASLLLLCLLEAPSYSLSNCAWGSWEGLLRCLGRKGGSAEAPPCNHFPLSTFFSTVGVSLKKKKKKKKAFLGSSSKADNDNTQQSLSWLSHPPSLPPYPFYRGGN